MDTDPALTQRIVSTREELDSAWIDGPPTPSGPIVVADYNPYARAFAAAL